MRRVLAKGDSQCARNDALPTRSSPCARATCASRCSFAIFTTASGLCTQPPITLTSLTRRASAISETWEQTALSSEV